MPPPAAWYTDPRLYALADRAQRWLASQSSARKGEADGSIQDPAIAQLVASSPGASSPAWDRLTEIAKERKAGGNLGTARPTRRRHETSETSKART